jgi:heme/copper-type cytochrome/quinol oxidase subunit 4
MTLLVFFLHMKNSENVIKENYKNIKYMILKLIVNLKIWIFNS